MEISQRCRPMLASIIILATLFTLTLAQNTTKCYAPNGEEATVSDMGVGSDLTLYACPPGDDGFATCCVSTDFCQPNNLCYNLNDGAPTAFRQYCTDPTWESDNCSDLCRTAGEENSSLTGAVGLSPCGDAKFCCGWFNTDCCENHEGTYAIQGFQVGLGHTYSASSTAQATSTASSSAISSATGAVGSQQSDTGSSFGKEAIAGVAVGAAGATAIFALAGALLWRRHKTTPTAPQDLPPTTQAENFPPTWGDRHSDQPPHFADPTKYHDPYAHPPMERGYASEMSGIPVRYELQGK